MAVVSKRHIKEGNRKLILVTQEQSQYINVIKAKTEKTCQLCKEQEAGYVDVRRLYYLKDAVKCLIYWNLGKNYILLATQSQCGRKEQKGLTYTYKPITIYSTISQL
uniref:Uncharacterized protein n=1 Tax=Micrurus lemniscatus lemniscatus TaxID=129467 RepID=A0A2D4H9Z7_MICLE